jgi:hypothetical protein
LLLLGLLRRRWQRKGKLGSLRRVLTTTALIRLSLLILCNLGWLCVLVIARFRRVLILATLSQLRVPVIGRVSRLCVLIAGLDRALIIRLGVAVVCRNRRFPILVIAGFSRVLIIVLGIPVIGGSSRLLVLVVVGVRRLRILATRSFCPVLPGLRMTRRPSRRGAWLSPELSQPPIARVTS